jgi:hypothetical protein
MAESIARGSQQRRGISKRKTLIVGEIAGFPSGKWVKRRRVCAILLA